MEQRNLSIKFNEEIYVVMINKFLILLFFLFLLNSHAYSAGTTTKENKVGTGGRNDFSHLEAKNSSFKKGIDAFKQAKKYEKKGKIEKAKKRFNDAIKFFIIANNKIPNEPAILNYLGYSFKKIGDFAMAEIYYEQGLAIDPQHILINQRLGELYIETNRVDKAKEKLKILESCLCEAYKELKDLIKKI